MEQTLKLHTIPIELKAILLPLTAAAAAVPARPFSRDSAASLNCPAVKCASARPRAASAPPPDMFNEAGPSLTFKSDPYRESVQYLSI